ncbi:MAG: tetratricopeptide repeat protein [Bacteroidota bacterium]|jgi:tetratricopeptide (TPR) repeat protein
MKTIPLLLACSLIVSTGFANNRDSAVVLLKKAKAARVEKRISLATNLFSQSIEQDPTYTEAYKELSEFAMDTRNYRQAYLALNKWAELEPQNESVYKPLANIHFMMGKHKEALAYTQKWEAAHPDEPLHLIAGMSSYYLENFSEAINRLMYAAEKDVENATLQYTIGRSYIELSRYAQAVPYYQKAIDLDKKNARYAYELAMVYYSIPDDKKSIAMFELAAQRGWVQNADFYENLAYSYMNAGNFNKAAELLRTSLEKRPYNLEVTYALGEAYYKGRNYKAAIEQWDQVIQMDSKNARSLYMIGVSYQKMGQKEKGTILCDKAIGMDPSLGSLKQKIFEGGL